MLVIDIETWISDKGNEEVHHFVDAETYLFGFNRLLLGEEAYHQVKQIVEKALSEADLGIYKKRREVRAIARRMPKYSSS